MAISKVIRHSVITLCLLIMVIIQACSSSDSNSTGSTPSGTIRVITNTTGSGNDLNGFTVTILQTSKDIAANDTVLFSSVSPGTYAVSLNGLDAGCGVVGSNPYTGAVVTDGNTTTVVFDIVCTATGSYGYIEVSVITSGTDPDTQYYVVVDGVDSTAANTGVTLPDTTVVTITDTVGMHQVELVGIAGNCNASTSNPLSVLVEENSTAPVLFTVNCAGDMIPNDIVFVRPDLQGIWQVWVCDAQANNQTQLTFGGTNKNLPRWAPEGSKILYNGEVVDSIGVVISGELVRLNADGSSPDTLVFPVDFSPVTADWSPDGTKLVVLGTTTSNPTEPNYFIYDFATISTSLLSYTSQPGWFDIKFSMPFWSPDGTEIVFSGENANLSTYHTPSVFTVPVTGGDAIFIANEQYWGFSYPQWSPDGSKLVFNGPSSHIWSCNANGTNTHAVHELGSYNGQPTWLPDGRIGFQPDNGVGLTIINDDGTGITTIGVGPDAIFGQPDWNPSP